MPRADRNKKVCRKEFNSAVELRTLLKENLYDRSKNDRTNSFVILDTSSGASENKNNKESTERKHVENPSKP